MLKSPLLYVLLLSCSGCGVAGRKACQASIKSQLMNPETAEFHDFEALPDGPAKAAAPDFEYRTYRVRAESRLGNRVTSTYVCAVSHESCTCRSGQ